MANVESELQACVAAATTSQKTADAPTPTPIPATALETAAAAPAFSAAVNSSCTMQEEGVESEESEIELDEQAYLAMHEASSAAMRIRMEEASKAAAAAAAAAAVQSVSHILLTQNASPLKSKARNGINLPSSSSPRPILGSAVAASVSTDDNPPASVETSSLPLQKVPKRGKSGSSAKAPEEIAPNHSTAFGLTAKPPPDEVDAEAASKIATGSSLRSSSNSKKGCATASEDGFGIGKDMNASDAPQKNSPRKSSKSPPPLTASSKKSASKPKGKSPPAINSPSESPPPPVAMKGTSKLLFGAAARSHLASSSGGVAPPPMKKGSNKKTK